LINKDIKLYNDHQWCSHGGV